MAKYLATQVCLSSELTVMPGVGHFCQLGSPERWLESVNAFYHPLENKEEKLLKWLAGKNW